MMRYTAQFWNINRGEEREAGGTMTVGPHSSLSLRPSMTPKEKLIVFFVLFFILIVSTLPMLVTTCPYPYPYIILSCCGMGLSFICGVGVGEMKPHLRVNTTREQQPPVQ